MAKYIKTEEGYKSLTDLEEYNLLNDEIINAQTIIDTKMDKNNPTGTGSFSLNRKANSVIGDYSFSEGGSTRASGYASHAEGGETIASGRCSHAEGGVTRAYGDFSHAEGKDTIASGEYSHAEGYWTKAFGDHSHVQGKYNIDDVDADGNALNTYAHIVGNGIDSDNRSNAHTLDWDGNAWFAGDVYVSSTSGTNKDDGSKKLATEEYVNNITPTFTVVGTTLVVGNANSIPAAEDHSF